MAKLLINLAVFFVLCLNLLQVQCQKMQVRNNMPKKRLNQQKKQNFIQQQTQKNLNDIIKNLSFIIREIKEQSQDQDIKVSNISGVIKARQRLRNQVMGLIYKQNLIKTRTQSQSQLKKYIVSNQFKGIGLYHGVPTQFVEGQVYRFFGIVLNPQILPVESTGKYNFVNIVFSQLKTNIQFRCTQKLTKSLEFDISCKIQKSGLFFLSIFAGMNGQSSPKLRNIKSYQTLFEPFQQYILPPSPQDVSLQIEENNLLVTWQSKASLSNLTIYQLNGNKVQYLLSNFHQRFKIPFADFNKFQVRSKTFIQLSHAQSFDGSLALKSTKYSKQKIQIQFYAQYHLFDDIIQQSVVWERPIPWKMQIGERFTLNAIFKQDVKNEVFIIEPDSTIKTINFIKKQKNQPPIHIIKAGNSVNLQLKFDMPGPYLIQINSYDGLAIINRPIYVGHTYPLIPDYLDLQNLVYNPIKNVTFPGIYEDYYQKTTAKLTRKQPSSSSSLREKSQFVLELVNGLRNKYKLHSVQLDEQLSKIAQRHADDMANNKYFSHKSLNGQGPRQRARKMNFTGSVGQNIAQSNFLIEGHLGLQRSAAHLENTVNDLWYRVGIGISYTQNKQYIMVFQFSTRDLKKYPLTKEQSLKIQKDLIDLIKQKNPNIIRQDKQLSSDIFSWVKSDRKVKMFEYLTENSNRVNKNHRKSMIGSYFTLSYSKDWLDKLRNSNYLSGFNDYQQVGVAVDVSKDQINKVQSYIVFA